jgi:hypothetical protein
MAVGTEWAVNRRNELSHYPVHFGGDKTSNGIGKTKEYRTMFGCTAVDFL